MPSVLISTFVVVAGVESHVHPLPNRSKSVLCPCHTVYCVFEEPAATTAIIGEGDLLVLLIALLGGNFPLAADAEALEGVEVAEVVVASAFLTLEFRSTPAVAAADVCF